MSALTRPGIGLGLDVGGTTTRAVALDEHGQVLGRGTAPGGNPASHGVATALARLADAVRQALDGADPGRVTHCLIGLSGYRALGDPAAVDAFAADARRAFALQPGTPLQLTSDAVIAFAAGTSDPDGTVLIAGTGSIACRVEHGVVTRTSGGLGWLLGDEGGGQWLGREAVRRALAGLRDNASTGPLVGAVLARTGCHDHGSLLRWSYRGTPQHLSTLAPLLGPAAEQGDPEAVAAIDLAAHHLCRIARDVNDDHLHGPVVLAGSVATGPGPLQHRLRQLLSRAGATAVLLADDPALAAAGSAHDAASGRRTGRLR
ncbi:hypothetical protein OG689_03940 [Kitasatospora sp. NBC_00240]|uniref:N-acetylglucosamine kinase n=1 Tax=Kitasatospora sp. NBC_00240 TaxID=2903567 RepID=UPI00224F38CD|nr:BadF/BadG/BcrA/BcrD ATPase family protein [Kitasatospora sp. NBC_00240]MCX5208454.1 hypothetical protein [Kitasatospora sp. NBC_00240]